MGNHCCASARHSSHSPSLYILDANTSTLTEYNIQKQEFLTYQITEPIPHLARYCLASNGKIMISGGCRKLSKKSRSRSLIDEPTNETFEYDQEIRTISTKKPMNEPRTGHVLLAFNSAVYSLTGAGSQLKPSITCEKYDILTDSWDYIASLQKARIFGAGCTSGLFLFISGGNPGTSLICHKDIERYNTITNTWEFVNLRIPVDLWRHACIPHKNGLLVFGGLGSKSYNLDCFYLDLEENTVTQLAWLKRGGEFLGINYGTNDRAYAFESSKAKVIWIFSNGIWTNKLPKK